MRISQTLGMGSLVSDLLYIRRSKKIIHVLVIFCIGATMWNMVPSLFQSDMEPDTFYFVMPYVTNCEILEFPDIGSGNQRSPLKWWLNCVSYNITDSYKLIPAIFGMFIMPLVYLLGYHITNDRMIGFFALVAFTVNPLYSDWATQGTYDQVWAFFFVLSLVLLFQNRPQLSTVSMLASFAAKSMGVMLLPVYLYTLYKQSKNISDVIIFLGIFSIGGIVTLFVLNTSPVGADIGFYPERWEDAVFRNIGLFWQVVPVLALFVVINRNFISKNHPPNQKLVGLWMISFLILNPIVYFFTLQDTYSYRYVPFAAFMSVFVGMTIVQLGNWIIERKTGITLKT